MSYDSFTALTVSEFEKAFSNWRKIQERNERTPWEVMRMQVAMTLQPFVKNDIDPKMILPLPWDQGDRGERKERKELTDEQRKKQTERVTRYLKTGHWD